MLFFYHFKPSKTWSLPLTLPNIPSTRMSPNEPPSALIKVDPQSPSSGPSRLRVCGYGYDDREFTEPTSGSSSPQATSAPALPQLPQPPLQVHIHRYPSTQRNLRGAGGGHFPGRPHTIGNPSPSSSLNVVCTLTYRVSVPFRVPNVYNSASYRRSTWADGPLIPYSLSSFLARLYSILRPERSLFVIFVCSPEFEVHCCILPSPGPYIPAGVLSHVAIIWRA